MAYPALHMLIEGEQVSTGHRRTHDAREHRAHAYQGECARLCRGISEQMLRADPNRATQHSANVKRRSKDSA